MIIHCKYDELVDPKDLKAHPKNRNKHPREQIERLAEIIDYQGFRKAITVSTLSGCITTGHCRVQAALRRSWEKIPVVYQDYLDEDQELADLHADNNIARWSEFDLSGLNEDLADFAPDFKLEMLGLKDFCLEPAEKKPIICKQCGHNSKDCG